MSCGGGGGGSPPQVIADPAAACVQGLRQGPQELQPAGRAATAGVQRGGNPPPAALPTQRPSPTPGRRHLGPVQLVGVPCLQVSAALCVYAVCLLCPPHVPFNRAACSMQLSTAPLMHESSIWDIDALSCVPAALTHYLYAGGSVPKS